MSEFSFNPAIRALQKSDSIACLRLSATARWNQTLWDWEMIIGTAGYHLAAMHQQKIIGTIASLDYGDFIWIAMVLVDPEYRRQGIATSLLAKIIEKSPDAIFRLDATPQGAMVYKKLGFHQVDTIYRWHYQGSENSQIDALTTSNQPSIDLSSISLLDHQVFGGNRSAVLSAMVYAYPMLAVQDKNSSSYLLGRIGKNAWQIGPIVAQNLAEASSLVRKLLDTFPKQAFYLDSFISSDWHEELKKIGFKKERELYRMQKGSAEIVANRESQFAIAGPELG